MNKVEMTKLLFKELKPIAVKAGYAEDVVYGMIAQSWQEGILSGLAEKYHNYWGMKAGVKYKGKTVAMNNKAGNDPAVYRAFDNITEGCKGYIKFLSYKRYDCLHDCTTAEDFLSNIGKAGWNSNPSYGSHCMSHLQQVRFICNNDIVDTSPDAYTAVALKVIKGMYGNGAYRRQKLTMEGYNYKQVQQRVNEILNK